MDSMFRSKTDHNREIKLETHSNETLVGDDTLLQRGYMATLPLYWFFSLCSGRSSEYLQISPSIHQSICLRNRKKTRFIRRTGCLQSSEPRSPVLHCEEIWSSVQDRKWRKSNRKNIAASKPNPPHKPLSVNPWEKEEK